MFDVCIVGAGPAGATLARLMSARYRVLLVDERFDDTRPGTDGKQKSCGGLLAPAAQRELARQGLGVPADVLSGPQLFAVRTVDRDAGLERLYQRHYVNVERAAFDRWLVSLVPSQVQTAFGWRLNRLEREGDSTMLSFSTASGGRAAVRARLVVGADGAASFVRRAAFASRGLPARYAAVQAVFAGASAPAHYGALFDSSITDYYGWVIPKGDTTLAGVALPVGPGVAARFDRFVDAAVSSGFRLGAELSRTSAMVFRAKRPAHLVLGDDRVMLVGEAAGLISPSSAEGISYALRSAAALADAAGWGLEGAGARYRRALAPVTAEVLAKIGKSSLIYGPATRRAVMRSGIGAIDAAGLGAMGGAIGELLAP